MNAGHLIDRANMSAERFVGFVKRPFGKQMELKIRQERTKGIGIMRLTDEAVVLLDAEPIEGRLGAWRHDGLKEAGFVDAGHKRCRSAGRPGYDLRLSGIGQPCRGSPRGLAVDRHGVGTKDGPGIPVGAVNQANNVILWNRRLQLHTPYPKAQRGDREAESVRASRYTKLHDRIALSSGSLDNAEPVVDCHSEVSMPMSSLSLALIIFGCSYLVIMTERIHKTIVALFGATLMIVFGVVTQNEAFYSHEYRGGLQRHLSPDRDDGHH